MVYRFTAVGIVAFWLLMMGLLVRLETHPDDTNILDVPVSYVMRVMFKHGQPSLLDVRDGDKPAGTLSLHPAVTGSNARALDFSGTLSLQLPLATRQRYNFSGALAMDAALDVQVFHLDFTVQETRAHLAVQGNMASKILTYQTYQGEHLLTSQQLPMNASGIAPALMQRVGLDPNTMPIIPTNITPPTVTARETQIKLHGEQLQVYQITVHEGTATAADIYITELGQIVLAKTNFGYTFDAEDYQ